VTDGTDPYVRFRDELFAAGYLLPTGVDGLYGRSAAFEDIIDGIDRVAGRAAARHAHERVRFAPVFPRAAFEHTDYLRSFPNLTGSIHTFLGNDRDHAALLAVADKGEDWSTLLEPAEVVLCSATCHPLYQTLSGRLPEGGRRFDMSGWAFRHEPSEDPARMQAFRNREFVYVGTPEGAVAHRDLWVEAGTEALRELGLDVQAEVANDPFFGRAGRMLAANQRDEALKIEVVAEVANPDKPTAILSSNCHLDHFGTPFGIETADGEVAHSACVGFGMERVALALLRRHGLDLASWPSSVRAKLFEA
jgi:seryl-tRNA synthetase